MTILRPALLAFTFLTVGCSPSPGGSPAPAGGDDTAGVSDAIVITFGTASIDPLYSTVLSPGTVDLVNNDDKDIQVDCEMAFATTTVSPGETATVTLDVLGEYQCSNLNFSAGQPNGFFLTVIAG